MTMPALFSPFKLRGLTLRNRVVLSPMCQYSAVDGLVQDWHHQHHARFASGGIALGFVEATGVTRDGRITHGCTGIWNDDQVPGLRRIVDLYHSYGAASGIQIGHAGRRASAERPWDGAAPIKVDKRGSEAAWERVAPSAIPEREGYPAPRALTEAEIEDLIGAFTAATRRALAAGFDVVEIHGAHGYLIHSFFSPHANQRDDAFGGSREKRMRFPLLVAEAVRAAWPAEKPLFYRASFVDGVAGGTTVEDTIALAKALKSRRVDLIDCSSGGMAGSISLSTNKLLPGFQVPYAAAVRREAQMASMAVGAIVEPKQAEAIIANGEADLVAIGRQFMAEPHWLYRAALELGHPEPDSVLVKNYAFYLSRRANVLDGPGADPRRAKV
jgi:2,4-dienoyl-CoA reductase-like NADH-dependent reductase (Old Yellow Enzyme family)